MSSALGPFRLLRYLSICLVVFASVSYSQIAKYGTGSPPQFAFSNTTSFPIFHGLNTTHVIVDCFNSSMVALPRSATDTNGFSYRIDTPSSVIVTFNSTQNGFCTVNGGIGQGIQGIPGPPGSVGPKGDAGGAATVAVGTVSTGAAGSQAAVANSGTNTAAVLNFTIPTGAAGPKGDPGSNGANGANGLSTYQNTGAPDSTLGSNNETYLDSITGDLYKKSSGSWVKTGNLTGPQGLRGPSGAGATWRGPWSSSTSYLLNDIVSYGGSSYIATQASLNVIPTNIGFWNLSAAAGAVGPAGTNGPAGVKGDPGGDPVATTASPVNYQYYYLNGNTLIPRPSINIISSGATAADDGMGLTTITIPTSGGGGGGGGTTSTTQTGVLSAIPSTCSVGSLYLATDQGVGKQLYVCSSLNAWTLYLSVGVSGALAITSGSIDVVQSVVPFLSATNTFTGLMNVQNGMNMITTNTEPPCASGTRGTFWYLNNGASKDNVQVCVYTGSAYSWISLY